MENPNNPDCFKCRYLLITWDPGRPYGCKAMGFKSSQIPWRVVRRSSGSPCLLFRPKEGHPGAGRAD